MKTLFVALVALLFAFFLGCQSSITDPEVPESNQFVSSIDEESFAYKDVFTFTYPNVFRLEGTLYDPSHRLNSTAEIDGVVRYGFHEVNDITPGDKMIDINKVKPSDISPSKKLKVNIFVDASLKANCVIHSQLWTVKKAAEQIVRVNAANQSVVYIEKSFRVNYTCCAPLDLLFKFEVNGKELRLVSMKLKLVDGSEPIDDEE
jgi:hypothetical protein